MRLDSTAVGGTGGGSSGRRCSDSRGDASTMGARAPKKRQKRPKPRKDSGPVIAGCVALDGPGRAATVPVPEQINGVTMRFPRPIAFLAASSLALAPAVAQASEAGTPEPAVEQLNSGTGSALGDEPLGAVHYLGFAAILLGLAYLISTQLLGKDDDEDDRLSP